MNFWTALKYNNLHLLKKISLPNDKRWTKLFTPDDGIKCKYYDASVEMEMTYPKSSPSQSSMNA